MELDRTDELVRRAAHAILHKDSRMLRAVISRLQDHVSPRLMLLAISSTQALESGDVLLALQYWDPFAEACRAEASTRPY